MAPRRLKTSPASGRSSPTRKECRPTTRSLEHKINGAPEHWDHADQVPHLETALPRTALSPAPPSTTLSQASLSRTPKFRFVRLLLEYCSRNHGGSQRPLTPQKCRALPHDHRIAPSGAPDPWILGTPDHRITGLLREFQANGPTCVVEMNRN